MAPRDVKNPHPMGIPARTAPFRDFFLMGMGAGINVTPQQGRDPVYIKRQNYP